MALDQARLKPEEEYKAAIKLQVEKFNRELKAKQQQFHVDTKAAQDNFHSGTQAKQDNFKIDKEKDEDEFTAGNTEKKDDFKKGTSQAKNDFYTDTDAAANKFQAGADKQGLSKIPDAKTAEREASKQGNSVSGILRELQQRKEAKGTGRLALGKEGGGLVAKDINKSEARKEKWGDSNTTRNNLMSDLYKRSKEEKAKGKLSKVKAEVENLGASTIGMATSELLEQSWLNIIDSWGLTLIYINFHVFCRFVFGPKMFCKLGHEWIGGKGGTATKAAGKVESAEAKGASQGGGTVSTIFGLPLTAVGILEGALLILVDVLVIVNIIISLMPFIIVGLIIYDPAGSFKFLWDHLGAFYEAFK